MRPIRILPTPDSRAGCLSGLCPLSHDQPRREQSSLGQDWRPLKVNGIRTLTAVPLQLQLALAMCIRGRGLLLRLLVQLLQLFPPPSEEGLQPS